MYALESGAAWTPELKDAFKHNVTRASVLYNNVKYNEDNFLKEAELQDVRYVPNVGFLGQAVAKMLTIKLVNDEDSNLNFENANIQFKIGAEYNGTTHYINFGNFIVNEPPENDDTNGTVKVIAYDYMIKFNKSYINRVVYPCTLKDLLLDVCSQAGVDLGSDTFLNENFIVEDNQFEGKQLREVLQHIAKSAFSWARIGQDNKLYLDFQVNNNIDETITIDEYKMDAFKKANEYYGPINKVTYADSDIKGQEISVQDDKSIATNGVKEIIIYDNYFAYTTEKRQQLIQAGSALFGLRYMPIQKLETIGLIYLDSNDIMGIEDGKGTTFLTRNFSHIIKYNGMTNDTFETTGESDNQRTYVNQNNSAIQNSRTEITVDRAKKQIQSVVSETIDPNNPNSMSNKLSQVTQTVSELSSQIKDIADITTSLESNSAKLQFEDVNQSEPIRVVIHPVGVNIAKLHPHTNLKPKAGLKMTTRILRFQNTTTNETFDYEIPDDLLYYDSENYDEFILDYESLSCVINKKCKWNNDGTVGLLPSERAVEYEFPHIELTEGDYTVSLIKYSNGYLFARMMIKNYYTAQFATRAELNSDIKQTVDDINLSVGKKLEGYSTTTEMNSTIDVKANAITQSVSENYATKTALGNTEKSLKSEIKSTAEAITTSVSETYVTNQSLEDNYSTTEQTATMISTTVSQTTKNNLKDVTVEYALGTSTTTAPTSGWSTTAPTWQQGKYMWQRTKTKTADGTESISNPTCIAGATGANGVSLSSITEYYAVSSSNTSAPADSAFKTTMQTMTTTNKYLWNYEIMTFSDNSEQSTIKRVIGTYGDKGTDGTNGKDGIGIKSVTNKYQVSTSNTTAPTSWSDTPKTMTPTNKYLWNYEIITYSNNTTTTSKPAVIGTYGDKGQAGTNGTSVSSITEYYAVSSSNTSAPADSSFKTTMQTMTATNKYLWNYEIITFSDNSTQPTTKRVIGVYGDKGIGITSVANKYQVSNSNTTAPTTWKDTPQTMTATNKYLWNYEIITYSNGTTTTSKPAVIGTYGEKGDKGNTGDTGKGVKGVVAQYYLSSSKTSQTGGSWAETQPAYKEKHYYWTRTKITWTDDTVTYTTPILVEEINSLNESVASLTIEAGKIKQRVDKIEDLTREVNGTKTITLTNCVKGSVLELHIYGNNSVFQAMYPTNTLYPQDNLYPKGDSLITVKYANNTTKTYELGVTEVLRKNGSVYDEYILESGQAQIIRRINSNGTVKTTPTTQNLGEFSIALEEGTNTITIKNYSADMYVKYAIKSAYTDIFATQVQMNSSITQTAEEINLEVSKKVDSNEVISKINQSAEAVGINANKINLSANDVLNLLAGNTINLSGKSIQISSNNFSVDSQGRMTCSNANITGGKFNVKGAGSTTDLVRVTNSSDSSQFSYLQPIGAGFVNGENRVDIFTKGQYSWGGTMCSVEVYDDGGDTDIRGEGIKTPNVTQTSLESQKKNFEKYTNALNTLKNIDIYKYNLKTEKDGSKKHIGFVIGEDFKYSEEVTSKNNDGADIYSFVSLCCQAIKEQQEEIEKLRKEVEK